MVEGFFGYGICTDVFTVPPPLFYFFMDSIVSETVETVHTISSTFLLETDVLWFYMSLILFFSQMSNFFQVYKNVGFPSITHRGKEKDNLCSRVVSDEVSRVYMV